MADSSSIYMHDLSHTVQSISIFNCQNDHVEVVYVNAQCAKLDTLQRKQLKVLQVSYRYKGSKII